MRKRLFALIDTADGENRSGQVYNYIMMLVILLSLVPLAFRTPGPVLLLLNKITVFIFILDYLARFATADLALKRGKRSFLLYPFTPLAITDLLAILPSLFALGSYLRLFKFFRLARSLRVLRIFKLFRHSKSFTVIYKVIYRQRAPLLAVCTLAAAYILIAALVIFNVEPETFGTFFDAVYWATVSLTTMGYGDIHPVTTPGRIVTMLSSVVGIAIVALPSSIITAGYMREISGAEEEETESGSS